jgi:hypothetical protein
MAHSFNSALILALGRIGSISKIDSMELAPSSPSIRERENTKTQKVGKHKRIQRSEGLLWDPGLSRLFLSGSTVQGIRMHGLGFTGQV